jgi:membrane-associated protein
VLLPQLSGALSSAVVALGPSWLDPQELVADFGGWALLGVSLIVFAETGLLLGFFLPGDTLLFTAGLLATTGAIGTPLWAVVLALVAAAVVGGEGGFFIGRSAGRAVLERSRLVQDDQLERAERFFARHGRKTLVLARFVPVVRTLVPVVAGAARMPQRTYAAGNVVGAVLWAAGLTLTGAWLGRIPVVRDFVLGKLDYVILGVVGLSLLLTLAQVVRQRRSTVRERRAARRAGAVHPAPAQPPVPAAQVEGPR